MNSLKSECVMRRSILLLCVLGALLGGVAVVVADGFVQQTHRPLEDDITMVEPGFELGDKPLFITAGVEVEGDMVIATKGDKKLTRYAKNFTAIIYSINFEQEPTGFAVDGQVGYVTAGEELFRVDLKSGKLTDTLKLDALATCPVVGRGVVYVLEMFKNRVAKVVFDKEGGMQIEGYTDVLREPREAVLSNDGKLLFVANFLPHTRADGDFVSAEVSVIETAKMKLLKNIPLANGSNALRGMALSTDGKYVFVSHNLGRYTVPTSQLQQGWMNTSAMSIIDAQTQNYVGSVILDEPDRGSAGAWDVKMVGDKILVAHSGTHDVSVIDYPAMMKKLNGYADGPEALAYDLRFLYGIRDRVPIMGNGPRILIPMANGDVAAAAYFSDTLSLITPGNRRLEVVPLVKNRQENEAQKGEKIFNDATYCFQNWQSCNGCHPGDARTDGMNWDLMNDGIGNPKNCKSLLYSIQTPPSMISGIRESAVLANRKGFTHIQFYEITEEMALAVDAYTKSLEAVPSPYLVRGKLSEKAKRGEKIFRELKCDNCHSGQFYTDMKMYKIGADIEFEAGWDTPSLRETWRTGPYLFDGRAATMREVFETYKHGIDRKLSSKEYDDLSEYVLSL